MSIICFDETKSFRDNRIKSKCIQVIFKISNCTKCTSCCYQKLQRSIPINEIYLVIRSLDSLRFEKGFLKRLGKSDVGGNNFSRLVKYSRRRSSSRTRSRRYVDEPTRTLRDATRGQILCGAS